MITVAQLKDILGSKTGGKPVSKIPNFYSMLYQAMLMVKSQVDLPSSIRTQQLVNPIYSDVDYYVVPQDLGMMAIINLRPIKPDTSYYDYHNFSQRQFTIENKFDSTSNFTRRYSIKYKDGTPYILISGIGEVPVVINNCESLTANGTWFRQALGTFYINYIPSNCDSATRLAYSVSDGTANNALDSLLATTEVVSARTVNGGVSNSVSTANAITFFANTKVACVYTTPNKKVVLNGGTVATTGAAAFPTSGYTTLNVGHVLTNSHISGHVKELRFYQNAGASDADLQTLTT